MTKINKQALVPYQPHEMFDLVEDFEAYPRFLPWCKDAKVLTRNGNQLEASLTLARGGLVKTFSTRNTVRQNESIEMHLLKGPFSRLHGLWQFHALGGHGCKVSLKMEFEISNRLLRMTLGPVFTHVLDTLVDAFIKRAEELYGNR